MLNREQIFAWGGLNKSTLAVGHADALTS